MISWVTTPLRHWKSFRPPVVAAALWPFARLVARDEIGVMERFVGLIGGTFCALAVLAGAHQLMRLVAR